MARGQSNTPKDETDAFLMGGESIPSLFMKKHPIGSTFEGEVVDKKMSQQTDAKTREPKFWDDGNPMMQMVVTLATDYDDEPNEDTGEDDGRRRLYVRGAMQKAIADACRKADMRGLAIGSRIKIKYTGDAKPQQRGLSGAKQFVAKVWPPEPGSEDGDFFDDDADEAPEPPKRSARKTSTRKAAPEPVEDDGDDDFGDEDEAPEPPKRRRAPAKKAASSRRPRREPVEDDSDNEFESDEDPGF